MPAVDVDHPDRSADLTDPGIGSDNPALSPRAGAQPLDGRRSDRADELVAGEFPIEGVTGPGEHGGGVATPIGEGDDAGVGEDDSGDPAAFAGDADAAGRVEPRARRLGSWWLAVVRTAAQASGGPA